MYKRFRPKGWKNPFSKSAVRAIGTDGKPISHHEAYEYGADEMLQSVKDLLQKEANETAGSPYGSSCLILLEEKLNG